MKTKKKKKRKNLKMTPYNYKKICPLCKQFKFKFKSSICEECHYKSDSKQKNKLHLFKTFLFSKQLNIRTHHKIGNLDEYGLIEFISKDLYNYINQLCRV